MIPSVRPILRALVIAVVSLSAVPAGGLSTGITGNSGKQGANCVDCHDGGVRPQVRLEGPAVVYAGALATFRFVVQSESSRQQLAGFNAAASHGRLEPLRGEGAYAELGELTHDTPKPATDNETSWQFTWRAPLTAGDQTLFGAGLSVNGNGTRSGDEMALLELTVTVSDEPRPGDANCDGSLSAADLTEITALTALATIGACDLADANCDGAVDQTDATVVIATLFDSPMPTQCPPIQR